jgi:hypothetical protein
VFGEFLGACDDARRAGGGEAQALFLVELGILECR